ncbi:hypothetical protein ALC60_03522 [Trachymyrmex zeteki]|uniref:Uncharacterized protein n=1 Tax=Mycetomoellerius zeteki TaxID=64791 RepID=A0A151XB84_9HYME|nr:hypothetical protein ALC60_03522 [Trachymyrmex zeteki]
MFFLPARLNGDRFLNFLENEFSDYLENIPLQQRTEMWFQLDGCPAHYSRVYNTGLYKILMIPNVSLHNNLRIYISLLACLRNLLRVREQYIAISILSVFLRSVIHGRRSSACIAANRLCRDCGCRERRKQTILRVV